MAASATTGFPIPTSIESPAAARVRAYRRRRISPQAGHALEILGHAIEYLTDEFVTQAELSPRAMRNLRPCNC